MTRQRDLEFAPEIERHVPLLRAALAHIGHRQTRNRGTIGGSLAHADPAAELPAICAAHDAAIEVASKRGVRTIPFGDFVAGFMTTAVEPDEIVTAITLPLWPDGHVYGFQEFARRHGDFALAGAAALLDLGPGAMVRRAAIALFGVATTPLRLEAGEAMLVGKTLDADVIRNAAATAQAIEAIADIHADAEYRCHLAGVMVRRALTDAAKRAGVSL